MQAAVMAASKRRCSANIFVNLANLGATRLWLWLMVEMPFWGPAVARTCPSHQAGREGGIVRTESM